MHILENEDCFGKKIPVPCGTGEMLTTDSRFSGLAVEILNNVIQPERLETLLPIR